MSDDDLFRRAMAELGRMSPGEMIERKIEGATTQSKESPGPRFDRVVRRDGFEPDARIDLHGLDREAAVARVERFLADQRRRGVFAVLVIHGKGRQVLARRVAALLDRHPAVAEHLTAPRRWGGGGARLVRLRR